MKISWTINKTPEQWRKEHNLTQQKMADLLKISRVAYHRIEKGISQPTLETITRMYWLGERANEIERSGKYKGYSTLKIGEMYEINIEEEEIDEEAEFRKEEAEFWDYELKNWIIGDPEGDFK